jgi:hypothetical protein
MRVTSIYRSHKPIELLLAPLEKNKSLDSGQIPSELIQAEDEILRVEIHSCAYKWMLFNIIVIQGSETRKSVMYVISS